MITGAAAGIGRATAIRFAEEGGKIAAWDVNEGAREALIAELEKCGGEALFSKVDVSQTPQVERAMSAVVKCWGRIDVLINNAGIVRDARLVKWKDSSVASTMSDESWDAVTGVNLKGVFLCTRAAVPHIIAGGGGVILNASSVVGLYGKVVKGELCDSYALRRKE